MGTTSSVLAEFVNRTRFEDLPENVVWEVKRILLDSLGCALAGLRTVKGKTVFSLGFKGGSPEATIVGVEQKVPASAAAFINGELLNALDYDVLCAPTGHVTPYLLSAPLAVAEWKQVSGKELILAVAISHEVAQRVCSGLIIPDRLSIKTTDEGLPVQLPIHGTVFTSSAESPVLPKYLGWRMKKSNMLLALVERFVRSRQ
jgi:2-methylcitrate dehydratase PrpD